MRSRLNLLLVFGTFCFAWVAVTSAEPRKVLESASLGQNGPRDWRLVAPAKPHESVELTFAIKQQNTDELAKVLQRVSDPTSPAYGQYLTLEEVQKLVHASQTSISAVAHFLKQHGVLNYRILHDFIEVSVPVEKAEELLHCKYFEYAHKEKEVVRLLRSAVPYSLPSSVAEHVDFVGGVLRFPQSTLKTKFALSKGDKAHWDLAVTPRFLKSQYKIGSAVGTVANNSQAVAQFLEQYYSNADLQEFFGLLLQSALGNKPATLGPNEWVAGVEASLDIEYIMSTGQSVPTLFWSNGGLTKGQEPFLKWMLALGQMKSPPLVISVSYGDDENSLSPQYMHRVETEFQKAGVRGVSILFASGDSGVGGSFMDCKRFVPSFPASAPSVTAVGGTAMSGFFEQGHEVVNGLSGGGFSDVFPQATYQNQAVTQYLIQTRSSLPAQSYWNRTGRAYPDISALSSNYLVVVNLIPTPGVAGTSCASPAAAGIVSLLNDLRLKAGKAPLGFLNPLLYQLGVKGSLALADITEGSNPGCGTDGFVAAPGWDPSSGWGSLNYEEFAKVVDSLP